MKRPALEKLALERMGILIQNAISNARKDPQLAQRQAYLARRLSMRHKVRMPYQLRMTFCKKCKKFIAPGLNSRVRLGRSSLKSIRITCNFCGHTYHKVLS
jgi:ribonuclease P protein subunit RPR2